ncbi:MAG: response regulator [Lachnospiraceae bacterium]|nr:response regulator [Lachnospiraceae bacterium]
MYTVFLVDDDTLILDELIETIPWVDNGFEVIGKETNPVNAVSKIRELVPDVVFVDLKMPVMDGNELIKEIRKSGTDCEFVMISAYDSFDNVRSFFKQSGFDYILKPVNIDDISIVLERLMAKLSLKHPYSNTISDDFNNSDENIIKTSDMTDNPNFNELLDYVNWHYNEKITLDMLADNFGFSRTYICNLFSKHLNTSLSKYITDIRMKKAKEMLSDKTLLLKEIAINLGYKEYYHFYKVFKAYYGYSPKENHD